MKKQAARGGDLTSHGGNILIPSCSKDVLINGRPAANFMSMHMCPMATPGSPPVPHVGGTVISPGVLKVLINGIPALGKGDKLMCIASAPAQVTMGSNNVVYGGATGRMGGVKAAGKDGTDVKMPVEADEKGMGRREDTDGLDSVFKNSAASALLAFSVYGAGKNISKDPKGEENDVDGEEGGADNPESDLLTVRDFAEILVELEDKYGYEAARRYAANNIDYLKICGLAKGFVAAGDGGADPQNPDNDPNLMPSRFMLLYGADDFELRRRKNMDIHPDGFDGQPEHEVSVASLREALWILGYANERKGPFDNTLYGPLLKYLNRFSPDYPQDDDAEEPNEPSNDSGDDGTGPEEPSSGADAGGINLNPLLYSDFGDSLLIERGGDPETYRCGVSYRYPWAPFTLNFPDGGGPPEGAGAGYEIYDRNENNRVLLAKGALDDPPGIKALLPDAEDVAVFLGSKEIELNTVSGGGENEMRN
ncbi:MAG: PAAR domain-containing protein [Chitinispirillia bacterium]|nr:PAAR domain-containing protein [Chitinispirillia bacterium]MCL2242032.1 PAAR domain-containing protein [Chitinispirillia bacterium]